MSRKITLTTTITVTLNMEDTEEVSEVFAEVDLTHPDATRVVDWEFGPFEITDSK